MVAKQLSHSVGCLLCLQAVREHFQRVKEDYMKQVDKLTGLVDSGLDPLEFVEASGGLSLSLPPSLPPSLPHSLLSYYSTYLGVQYACKWIGGAIS